MAAFIRDRLPSVNLIEADGAAVDFRAVLPGAPWRCVANLPYNAGTRMITRMLEAPDVFDRLLVMVQREVAERLVAAPCDRKRGSLSVFTEARAELASPSVCHLEHSILRRRFTRRLSASASLSAGGGRGRPSGLRPFGTGPIRAAAKTIRNNLAQALGRGPADDAVASAALDPTRRPATLTLAEITTLAETLSRPSPLEPARFVGHGRRKGVTGLPRGRAGKRFCVVSAQLPRDSRIQTDAHHLLRHDGRRRQADQQ